MKSKTLKIVLSVILTTLFVAEPVLAQEAMSSGAYKIQSDSVNFAGALSQSGSYSIQDTLGEISTGRSSSASFAGQIGYQAMLIAVSTDTTPPSAPPTISATPITTSRIEVAWGESTDNVAVTRYFIYRDGIRVADVGIFPRFFVDSGLSADTLYAYNVSAADDAGNESLWSATTTARTLRQSVTTSSARPIILSDLSIIPSDTRAIISFGSGVGVRTVVSWGTDTQYTSGTQTDDELSDSHRFILNGLSPNTLYYLKIMMTRADGYSSTYENIFFSTLSVPSAVLPPNVLSFSATAGEKDIVLDWTMPTDPTLVGVRIVRSKDFYPSTPQDGEAIFEGVGENFVDTNVIPGVKYYYSIFTKDFGGNFSSGAVADAQIFLPGQAGPPTSTLDDLEIIGDVHPMIAGLEIKDFLFIQDGNSLKVKDGLVTIDGSKNLTVALKYYRVPPVLKTIAVTLVTKDKEPKSFTFILRLNRDKTRYEATVGSLGSTNSYVLKIVITDFKNQGLKKLRGTMVVFGDSQVFRVVYDARKFLGWGFVFILLIIMLLAIKKWLERTGQVSEEKKD